MIRLIVIMSYTFRLKINPGTSVIGRGIQLVNLKNLDMRKEKCLPSNINNIDRRPNIIKGRNQDAQQVGFLQAAFAKVWDRFSSLYKKTDIVARNGKGRTAVAVLPYIN